MPSSQGNGTAFSKHSAEFTGKSSDLSQDFKDLSKITGSLATDAVNMVQDNAALYYGEGMKQARKFEKSIESRIQKNPLQSLAIVAGIGLVLGALWNRR